MLGGKWWFEGSTGPHWEVKDFGPTPFDYIPTDLD